MAKKPTKKTVKKTNSLAQKTLGNNLKFTQKTLGKRVEVAYDCEDIGNDKGIVESITKNGAYVFVDSIRDSILVDNRQLVYIEEQM